MANFNLNTGLSLANELAFALGVNNWQIQNGKYNGESFFVVSNWLGGLNSSLNPLAGAWDNIKLLGSADNSIDSNENLPYGTMAKALSVSDSGKAKVMVFTPPNNSDVFEDMGWYGETINVKAVIAGSYYQDAIRNFFRKAISPMLNGVTTEALGLHVLEHPVFGAINDVRLVSYKRMHMGTVWRGSVWDLTFRTAKPLFLTKDSKADDIWSIYRAKIGNILALAQSIAGLYGAFKAVYSFFSNLGNKQPTYKGYPLTDSSHIVKSSIYKNSSQINLTNSVDDTVGSAINNSLYGTHCIASNFIPREVSIPKISYDIDYVYPQMQYFIMMAPADVNNAVDTIYNSINLCIDAINSSSKDNSAYELIESLQAMIRAIGDLASTVMNDYLGATFNYEVKTDSDLMTVCLANGINFAESSQLIWKMNYNKIDSYNHIAGGTILTLPIGG